MTDLEILKDPRMSLMSLANALMSLAEAWPEISPKERAMSLWAIGEAIKALREVQEKRMGAA